MHCLRTWVAPCLVALGVLGTAAAVVHGQTVLGRGLGLQKCSYRVYYRTCDSTCWKVYATYTDCKTAQEAVDFLRWTGRDAYQSPVGRN